jgi:hypothetical protein
MEYAIIKDETSFFLSLINDKLEFIKTNTPRVMGDQYDVD